MKNRTTNTVNAKQFTLTAVHPLFKWFYTKIIKILTTSTTKSVSEPSKLKVHLYHQIPFVLPAYSAPHIYLRSLLCSYIFCTCFPSFYSFRRWKKSSSHSARKHLAKHVEIKIRVKFPHPQPNHHLFKQHSAVIQRDSLAC